jgi:hypothetical protein
MKIMREALLKDPTNKTESAWKAGILLKVLNSFEEFK